MIVNIEKIVYGGKGLGKLNSKTCFIPYVLPNEKVKINIKKDKKSFCEGYPLEILEKSEYRVNPECEYYTKCGGCDFQHISYEKQLDLKKEILEEALFRLGKIEKKVDKIIPSENPFYYRNRVQFKINNGEFGFFAPESNDIINIDSCKISHLKINEAIESLKKLSKNHKNIKEIHIFYPNTEKALLNIYLNEFEELDFQTIKENLPISINGAGIYLKNKRIKTFGKSFTFEKVGKYNFRISLDSFFQVNRFQIENILNEVLKEIEENKIVGDIFCGVGLFTIPVAKKSKKSFGVEINKSAVKDANYNLKINNIQNTKIFETSASKALDIISGYQPEILIFDPPRTGLYKDLINKVLNLKKLEKIVYVSCNPATASRDINLLADKFKLKKVKMIDMFPQTHHIESIFVLERI